MTQSINTKIIFNVYPLNSLKRLSHYFKTLHIIIQQNSVAVKNKILIIKELIFTKIYTYVQNLRDKLAPDKNGTLYVLFQLHTSTMPTNNFTIFRKVFDISSNVLY